MTELIIMMMELLIVDDISKTSFDDIRHQRPATLSQADNEMSNCCMLIMQNAAAIDRILGQTMVSFHI